MTGAEERFLLRLVRSIVIVLTIAVLFRAAPAVADAWRYGAIVLVASYAGVEGLLVMSALLLEMSVRRRGYGTFGVRGAAILVVCSAAAVAIGRAPGILPSLPLALAAILLLGVVGAMAAGPRATALSRAATVLLCAGVGAAFDLAVAPLLATLVIHH